jgi:hypothetical protein
VADNSGNSIIRTVFEGTHLQKEVLSVVGVVDGELNDFQLNFESAVESQSALAHN